MLPNTLVVIVSSHTHLVGPPTMLDSTYKGSRCKGHWQPKFQSGGASQQQNTEPSRGHREHCHRQWSEVKKMKKDRCSWCWRMTTTPNCMKSLLLEWHSLSHAEQLITDYYHLKRSRAHYHQRCQNRCNDWSICNCANTYPKRNK